MIGPAGRQVDRGQDAVGHVGQLKAVGVDQQQLLLQPHAERLPLPERVSAGPLRCQGVTPSAARAAIRPSTSAAASPLA